MCHCSLSFIQRQRQHKLIVIAFKTGSLAILLYTRASFTSLQYESLLKGSVKSGSVKFTERRSVKSGSVKCGSVKFTERRSVKFTQHPG